MSSTPRPARPLPAAVYRRRRLVLLLAVVAVIAVVVLIVVRPGSASGGGSPSGRDDDPRSSATGAPTSSSSATPGATGACAPASVALVAVTDAATYADGVQPQLSMSITNTGSAPCTFDVGTAAQDYTISSGAERIWDSRDCQTGAAADVRTLAPGTALTTQPFPWDRTRSAKTTCDAARPAVVAGGASYHLTVSVGSATSADSKQFVLG